MHQDVRTGQKVLSKVGGWRILFRQQPAGHQSEMVWELRGKTGEELFRSTAPVIAMNARAAGNARISKIWHGR